MMHREDDHRGHADEDRGPRSLKMGILINGLAGHHGPEDLAFSCA